MRAFAIVALLALVLPFAAPAQAVDFTVDPTISLGYMNVFELDGTTFVFGSPWGFGDLVASFSGPLLTLSPNTIGDPDPFWYIGGGGPGAAGNKIMEAVSYFETLDGSLAGQTVNFSFEVLSSSLTSQHVVAAFIRDWAPDFSSANQTVVPLLGTGAYSLTLNTINNPARPVQYGFIMRGPNVWITDVAAYGNMVIGPDLTVATEQSSIGAVKSLYK